MQAAEDLRGADQTLRKSTASEMRSEGKVWRSLEFSCHPDRSWALFWWIDASTIARDRPFLGRCATGLGSTSPGRETWRSKGCGKAEGSRASDPPMRIGPGRCTDNPCLEDV